MSFYRNILKQAWKITWRNKYLWWLGIFAALLGNGGEFEILFNNAGSNPGRALFPAWQGMASTGVFSFKTYANIGNLLKYDTLNMVMVLILALAALAALLFLVWLVIVSQAAIVNNSAALLNQKKSALRDGWESGILNFWPVFTLNILVKAAVYLMLFAISLPVIFIKGSLNANPFYILALIMAFPLAIIMSFITKYAIADAVINKSTVGQALKRGWRLFIANWLVSFEMAIILFFINILVGLAIILAILALAVPFLFLGLIFYYSFSAAGSWLVVSLAFAGFLFIVVSGGAALSVFQITSWTSLFLELDKKRGASKLVRMVNRLVKY